MIVKQRLESGEEVNAANTWGKYTLCKEGRLGQKLKAGLGSGDQLATRLSAGAVGRVTGEQEGADTGHLRTLRRP